MGFKPLACEAKRSRHLVVTRRCSQWLDCADLLGLSVRMLKYLLNRLQSQKGFQDVWCAPTSWNHLSRGYNSFDWIGVTKMFFSMFGVRRPRRDWVSAAQTNAPLNLVNSKHLMLLRRCCIAAKYRYKSDTNTDTNSDTNTDKKVQVRRQKWKQPKPMRCSILSIHAPHTPRGPLVAV